MKTLSRFCAALALLLFAVAPGWAQQGFSTWDLQVNGAARQTLVFAPPTAKTAETPVVFVFHGHGGKAEGAVRMFGMNRHWPEAISVYMQGLNTPGRLTDPKGLKPGWQHGEGGQEDRDLHFFDAVLAKLKSEYKVDARRIYSTGHSNGGGFTYLLWQTRGDVFAAMGPSGAASAEVAKMAPKPAIHVAGRTDPLVKFEWQQRAMDAVRKLNGCEAEGTAWAENATLYASKTGTPFVAFIHPGGHGFPTEAAPLLAKFFREQVKP